MEMLTTPLYSALAEERATITYFLLDKQIGPDLRLSEHLELDLRSMFSPAQSKSMKPMRFNAVSTA